MEAANEFSRRNVRARIVERHASNSCDLGEQSASTAEATACAPPRGERARGSTAQRDRVKRPARTLFSYKDRRQARRGQQSLRARRTVRYRPPSLRAPLPLARPAFHSPRSTFTFTFTFALNDAQRELESWIVDRVVLDRSSAGRTVNHSIENSIESECVTLRRRTGSPHSSIRKEAIISRERESLDGA